MCILNKPIEELDFRVRTYNPLKRAGFNTVGDLVKCSEYDFRRVRCFGRHSLEEVIEKLTSLGLELRRTCEACDMTLSDEDLEIESKLCGACRERILRTLKVKDITLEVLRPKYDTYAGGYNGFHIFINIINNTSTPIKLELKECTIFKYGRQNVAKHYLSGYDFTTDYVFPNSVKTFAKIWDGIISLDFGDLLTVSLKDVDTGKTYFFKYIKEYFDWIIYDYYEVI